MERSVRLRTSREWREVRRQGRCVGSAYATFCLLSGGVGPRYGFSTSKGFRTAVARNRARRRLREAFRRVHVPCEAPCAITGTARPQSLSVSFEQLTRSVSTQLAELGVPVVAGNG